MMKMSIVCLCTNTSQEGLIPANASQHASCSTEGIIPINHKTKRHANLANTILKSYYHCIFSESDPVRILACLCTVLLFTKSQGYISKWLPWFYGVSWKGYCKLKMFKSSCISSSHFILPTLQPFFTNVHQLQHSCMCIISLHACIVPTPPVILTGAIGAPMA